MYRIVSEVRKSGQAFAHYEVGLEPSPLKKITKAGNMSVDRGGEDMTARYFNPYTDFGFKKLFGEEANKALLIDFLNSILPPERKIADLTFGNTERLQVLRFQERLFWHIRGRLKVSCCRDSSSQELARHLSRMQTPLSDL